MTNDKPSTQSATVSDATTNQNDDLVLVRRGTLASACYAIRARTSAPKTLEALRAAARSAPAPAPVDEAEPIIGMVADWVESAKKAGIESPADLAAIIRQRLAPFVATGEPVAKGKRLIGWRSENYLHETADRDTAINWEPHFGVLPIFEGDENTSLKAPGEPVASPLPYEWFAERSAEPWMIPIVEKWGRELERTLASRWGIKLEGGQG